jgi:hypothetical protein
MREIRRLCPNSHQTSIVTTNTAMSISLIAIFLFGRWIQENFFRYMRQDYAIDKLLSYGIEELNSDMKVVNREYSKYSYNIKKEREKLARIRASLYIHHETLDNDSTDDKKGKAVLQIIEGKAKEKDLMKIIEDLISQRSQIPYKISIAELPKEEQYNKLNQETKAIKNQIAMICYHAETALANKLRPHYSRANEEIRTLVKTIINQPADILPDDQTKTLRIRIYPMPTMRAHKALESVLEQINQTQTCFPGTDMTMFFEITTI